MHTRRETYGDFKECIQSGLMQDLELQKKSEALVTGDGAESKKGQAA